MLIKRKIIVFVIASLLVMGSLHSASAQQSAFKAAFLYHFTEYITWEKTKMETFDFAVLEDSPITSQLAIIARDKKVKNKKITVTQYSSLDDIANCHILFIPAKCSVPLETVISKFSGKPVLIVTEKDGEGKKGSHINFFIAENKLKFEINQKAADKSKIDISSQLLQHAIIID